MFVQDAVILMHSLCLSILKASGEKKIPVINKFDCNPMKKKGPPSNKFDGIY